MRQSAKALRPQSGRFPFSKSSIAKSLAAKKTTDLDLKHTTSARKYPYCAKIRSAPTRK